MATQCVHRVTPRSRTHAHTRAGMTVLPSKRALPFFDPSEIRLSPTISLLPCKRDLKYSIIPSNVRLVAQHSQVAGSKNVSRASL